MSEMKHAAPSSGADSTIEALHRIDDKVNMLRDRRLNDPDSLLDKAFKRALPALTGAVAGKLFQLGWERTIGRGVSRMAAQKGRGDAAGQGLLMSIAFAAASAAFGAVVAQLSDRTSKAIVARRHRRR